MAITEGRRALIDLTDKELREGLGRLSKNIQYSYHDYERELGARKQSQQYRRLIMVAIFALLAPLAFEVGKHFCWW